MTRRATGRTDEPPAGRQPGLRATTISECPAGTFRCRSTRASRLAAGHLDADVAAGAAVVARPQRLPQLEQQHGRQDHGEQPEVDVAGLHDLEARRAHLALQLAQRVAPHVVGDAVLLREEELVGRSRGDQHPAGLEHAVDLAQRPDVVLDVLERVEGRDAVEAGVAEAALRPVAGHEQRELPRRAVLQPLQGDVGSDHAAVGRHRRQHAAHAAAQVHQHAVAARAPSHVAVEQRDEDRAPSPEPPVRLLELEELSVDGRFHPADSRGLVGAPEDKFGAPCAPHETMPSPARGCR